jgi:hypothetical protein
MHRIEGEAIEIVGHLEMTLACRQMVARQRESLTCFSRQTDGIRINSDSIQLIEACCIHRCTISFNVMLTHKIHRLHCEVIEYLFHACNT